MFDAADSLLTWTGLTLAAAAFLGAALAVPHAPPPDATAVADAVDRVAASDYDAAATVDIAADEVRVGPRRLSLRGDGGTTHAVFAERVVPARPDSPLDRVLRGGDPDPLFETPGAFARAAALAWNRPAEWRSTETLRVRHVVWGGVDVVLVG